MIECDPVRYGIYCGIPRFVEPVADLVGVKLSDDALRNQALAAAVIGLADQTYDHDPDTRDDLVSTWQTIVQTGSAATAIPHSQALHPQLVADLHELHQRITPTQAQRFFNFGMTVLSYAERYRPCEDVDEYLALRKTETGFASAMMTQATPIAEQQQPAFMRYEAYASIVRQVGVVVDSARDFWQDAQDGSMHIPPTRYNKFLLDKRAAAMGARCIQLLGVSTMAKIFLAGKSISRELNRGEPPNRRISITNLTKRRATL